MTAIICDKKTYQKRKDGVKDIVGMSKKYKQKFTLYECNKCGLFHITTIHKHSLNKTRDTKYPIKVQDVHYEKRKPKETKRILKKSNQRAINIATDKFISLEMAERLKQLFVE